MVLNDIQDIQIDRVNALNRPLPSGKVGVGEAYAFSIVLSGLAITFSAFLGGAFTLFDRSGSLGPHGLLQYSWKEDWALGKCCCQLQCRVALLLWWTGGRQSTSVTVHFLSSRVSRQHG